MKYLIIILLLITSCSSERICRKAKQKGCYTIDSVIVKDTLILTDYDTMVQFKDTNEVDTLFIDNGGIKTVVFTKWKTKEVRIVQKADTIIKERKVPQIQVKQLDCPKDRFWLGFVLGMIFIALLIVLVFKTIIWIGKTPR